MNFSVVDSIKQPDWNINGASCSVLWVLGAPPTLTNFGEQGQATTKDMAKIERLCDEYININFKWTHHGI